MTLEAGAGRRAVFLDRDGVLNRAVVRDGRPYPPSSVEELEIEPGAAEACDTLHRAGFLLLVVTNQPDIARGHVSSEEVASVNDALRARLPLDDVLVCAHDDADRCDCRKPLPGLILSGAERWDVDPRESFVVGDRWRDVEAGRRAGCRTVFVDHGYREQRPHDPDIVVRSLLDAVPAILTMSAHGEGAP